MDPISAIFVMTVLGGLFVKGVDVATDGLLSAEVGAGVRGAGSYAWRAERARWGRARAKAREIRQQTPQGQAVQEILDLAGLFGRTLFGELRQFGSGVRSEWRTARDQARSDRTGRRGDAPWPIVRAARSGAVRVREWAERRTRSGAATPNEPEPNEAEPNDPNGDQNDPPPPPPGFRYVPSVTGSGGHFTWDLPWPDDDPYAGDDDSPVDPNGDPNVPLPSTVPDANGDVQCGCCAHLHKPLPPGEHCPNCHIHDQPTPPNQPAQSGPTKGTAAVADINSAPAAIAAAEAFAPRFESLQSRADDLAGEWDSLKNDADALHGEIATLMDGMGDFAIGGEADTAAVVGELSESATSAKEQADNVVGSISTAKEAHAAYVDNLHLEYDASIEAAAGKAPAAHAVMQEA